jgi:hypothetical protein
VLHGPAFAFLIADLSSLCKTRPPQLVTDHPLAGTIFRKPDLSLQRYLFLSLSISGWNILSRASELFKVVSGIPDCPGKRANQFAFKIS